jgi:hypothetical protein
MCIGCEGIAVERGGGMPRSAIDSALPMPNEPADIGIGRDWCMPEGKAPEAKRSTDICVPPSICAHRE